MGRNSVLDRHWTGFFLKLITHRITIFLQICMKLLCLPVPASLIFCFVSFFLSAFKTFMQFSADRVRLNSYIINRHRRRVYSLERQTKQGRIKGGAVRGAPPPWEILGGRRPPPWILRILRERTLSLTTAIEKETKRKKVREKDEIYHFWSYHGQRNPPPPTLLPFKLYQFIPFSPFFL